MAVKAAENESGAAFFAAVYSSVALAAMISEICFLFFWIGYKSYKADHIEILWLALSIVGFALIIGFCFCMANGFRNTWNELINTWDKSMVKVVAFCAGLIIPVSAGLYLYYCEEDYVPEPQKGKKTKTQPIDPAVEAAKAACQSLKEQIKGNSIKICFSQKFRQFDRNRELLFGVDTQNHKFVFVNDLQHFLVDYDRFYFMEYEDLPIGTAECRLVEKSESVNRLVKLYYLDEQLKDKAIVFSQLSLIDANSNDINTIIGIVDGIPAQNKEAVYRKRIRLLGKNLDKNIFSNRPFMYDRWFELLEESMKDVLQAMGILIMEKEGLEADDILGTFAKKAQKEGMEVALVSGDRDLLQVADEHIKIRIPKTKGGKTEIEDYYAKDVMESLQVTPVQFIELKALMGDTSDNIPGVPKVGPKTATELMVTYGSLDSIYEHLDEISKKSVRETLREHRNLAELSKVLATIEINADIPYTLDMAKYENPFTKEAYIWFKKLELKNLLNKFEEDAVNENNEKDNFKIVTDFAEADKIFEVAKSRECVAFCVLEDKATKDNFEKDFIGLSLCLSKEEVYIILQEGFLTQNYLCDKLKDLSKRTKLITFDIKQQYSYLDATTGRGFFDILIGAYLCNPLKSDYGVVDIANEYLGLMISDKSRLLDKLSLRKALEIKTESFKEYAGFLSYVSFMAYPKIKDRLENEGMLPLFENIEMPLSFVLYSMEKEGVNVEKDALKAYGDALAVKIEKLETNIYEQAGEKFNLNSPKQLGEILFGKLQIPGGKKTKTGYSTAAEVLEKLAPEYPMIADILEYRTLAKLKSTYADGLGTCIREDGKIHTTFNQTITATGRISSTEPNLQNIPMRLELGRQIRKVFVPKKDYIFVTKSKKTTE